MADATKRPLPGALVIEALRAMNTEARKRGEMFPQTNEEQREDTAAVRRVVGMLEFYTSERQSRDGWPTVKGWPALPDGVGALPAQQEEAPPK